MGSGKYLLSAIKKHGVDNFTKEILFVFDNSEDMYAKEAELVNEDFLAEANTYNLKVGGFGGWHYVNNNKLNNIGKTDDSLRRSKLGLDKGRETQKLLKSYVNWLIPGFKSEENQRKAIEASKSPEAIAKRKETNKKNKHQQGVKNSQYGKMWIFNSETKECKTIPKTQEIPEGWIKGRVMPKSSNDAI
jgi:hypothetical protein